MESVTAKPSRLGNLVAKAQQSWIGGKVLEVVVDEALQIAQRTLRRRAGGILSVLEATRETHFTKTCDAESEELLRVLAASHRSALLQVLHQNQSRNFPLSSFLADSECALRELNDGEMDDLLKRIATLEDPTLRVVFQVLINNRDQLLFVLEYLKKNGLLDLNAKQLTSHLPRLIQGLRDFQHHFIQEQVAVHSGPIGEAYDLLSQVRRAE